MPEGQAVTEDERARLEAELDQITGGWTLKQLVDMETMLPEDQELVIASLRAEGRLSWSEQPSTLERVGQIGLALLSAGAAVANPVSAIAGGVSSVAGVLAAIRK